MNICLDSLACLGVLLKLSETSLFVTDGNKVDLNVILVAGRKGANSLITLAILFCVFYSFTIQESCCMNGISYRFIFNI